MLLESQCFLRQCVTPDRVEYCRVSIHQGGSGLKSNESILHNPDSNRAFFFLSIRQACSGPRSSSAACRGGRASQSQWRGPRSRPFALFGGHFTLIVSRRRQRIRLRFAVQRRRHGIETSRVRLGGRRRTRTHFTLHPHRKKYHTALHQIHHRMAISFSSTVDLFPVSQLFCT